MGFQSGDRMSKLDFASFATAALSYLILRKGDRVSLQIFDKAIRHIFPPGSTRTHLNNILTSLESNLPGEETSLSTALDRAYPLIKRKGTLIILSDFFDQPADIFTALNPYLHRGFRIHLFHILDPDELDLTERGLATFTDLENNDRLVVHTDTLRPAYKEAMKSHITALRQLATTRGIDYALTRTDSHHFQLLDHLMNSSTASKR